MHAPLIIGQDRFDLSADALLISSGIYAATAVLVLPTWWLLAGQSIDPANIGAVVEDSAVLWPVLAFLAAVGFWVGPAVAWRLHGRRQRFRLVIAPLLSPVIVLMLAILGPMFAGLYHVLLDNFIDWQYSGEAAAFAVLGALHLTLVVHASRGVKARALEAPALRGFRIAALLALSALTMVVAIALVNGFDAMVVQALLFVLAIGYAAGLTTHIAAAIDDMEL